MIHVTANEAGRNAVYYDKTSKFFENLIEKIENNEIVMCLKAFIKYTNRTLKLKPTNQKVAYLIRSKDKQPKIKLAKALFIPNFSN